MSGKRQKRMREHVKKKSNLKLAMSPRVPNSKAELNFVFHSKTVKGSKSADTKQEII